MNQNLLEHIDRSLKNKPAPIRRESKVDIVMKRIFETPQIKTEVLSGGEAEATGVKETCR